MNNQISAEKLKRNEVIKIETVKQEKSLESVSANSRQNDACVVATTSVDSISENVENNNNWSLKDEITILEINTNKTIAVKTLEDLINKIKDNKTISLECISNSHLRDTNKEIIRISTPKLCEWLCKNGYVYMVKKGVYVATDSSKQKGYYVDFDEFRMSTSDYKIECLTRGYITPIGKDHLLDEFRKINKEAEVQEDGRK